MLFSAATIATKPKDETAVCPLKRWHMIIGSAKGHRVVSDQIMRPCWCPFVKSGSTFGIFNLYWMLMMIDGEI
jgi:hypothetical protein